MSVDISDLEIFVKFAPHPTKKDAHTQLNNLYSGYLDYKELFSDPKQQESDKLKSYLQDQIVAQICTKLINPYASQTTDKSVIPVLIKNCTFRVQFNGQNGERYTKKALIRNLLKAKTAGKDTIDLILGINHLYFEEDVPLTYLDWSKILDVPPAVSSVAPAALTAVDIATAVTNALAAAPLSTTAAPAPAPTPATSASTIATAAYVFNPGSLPADVLLRYQRKTQNRVILGSTIKKSFDPLVTPTGTAPHGFMYYQDGPERIILADGTLYIVQVPNEKGLFRQPVRCADDTHAGVRNWYQVFTQHVMDHGFFVLPIWCFRKGHGGEWGFSFGDTADDDLPLRMGVPIMQMRQPLYRLLSDEKMFPKDSKLQDIVAQCYGDGYKAIKQILFASHPAFRDQPATLITSYPRQKNLTLLQYYKHFIDYLQLKAYVHDDDSSLDDANELDVFIAGAKYSDFLNRVTRDERRQASMAQYYRASTVVETLSRKLMEPDSPASRDEADRARQLSRAQTDRRRTYNVMQGPNTMVSNRRIHHLSLQDTTPDLQENSSEDTVDSLCGKAQSLQVPEDYDSKKLHHVYTACVYQLASAPQQVNQFPCICCGGQHMFDQCPVLQNSDFLRSHYIRYCQQVRKEATARAAAFAGQVGAIPLPSATTNNRPVNYVDIGEGNPYNLSLLDGHEDSDDEGEDFQSGRR